MIPNKPTYIAIYVHAKIARTLFNVVVYSYVVAWAQGLRSNDDNNNADIHT